MFILHKFKSDNKNNTSIKMISFLCGVRPSNPCAMYRVFNIVEGLVEKGIECNVFYRTINITAEYLDEILKSDIVVIYRERYKDNVKFIIDLCRHKNIPLIYDCDDLIFETKYIGYDPMYQACLEGNYASYGKDWKEQVDNYYLGIQQYKEALLKCNYFTSPNELLNNYVKENFNRKSFYIPNTINTAELELSNNLIKQNKKNKIFTIGYFGGQSHTNDFKEISDTLFNFLNNENKQFICIGSLEIDDKFKLLGENFNHYKIEVPHAKMIGCISEVDVTIAPLKQDNFFNECKSDIKITESAIAGISCIASKTHAYNKLYSEIDRTDLLYNNNEDFYKRLAESYYTFSYLYADNHLRDINKGLREAIINKYFINNVIDKIINIYESCL